MSSYKPGDWYCAGCNMLIFASKDKCFKCGTLKKDSQQTTPTIKSPDWNCLNCQVLVFGSKNNCFKCGTPKPVTLVKPDVVPSTPNQPIAPPKIRSGDWNCPNCNFLIFASKDKCFK